MRYPPKLRRIISQTQADWVSDEGPDILEEVPADPGVRTARDYDLVHFDLDPKNSEFCASCFLLSLYLRSKCIKH